MNYILKAPIIEFDTIDSTNNYAMQLLNADKAQTGLTVITRQQSAGKGQRGKTWADNIGESTLMSICILHNLPLMRQFCFSAAVALAVARTIQRLLPTQFVRIKWPNDIIINDKKTAGILIENSIRGNKWIGSVAGIGINVLQKYFSSELPNATSLFLSSGEKLDIRELAMAVREEVLLFTNDMPEDNEVMEAYNKLLYKHGEWQLFEDGEAIRFYRIKGVLGNGKLVLEDENGVVGEVEHGMMGWKW